MPTLRRRPDSQYWYAEWWEERADGARKRKKRCTRCTDKSAALACATRWERDAADPAHAAARTATLSDALGMLLAARSEEARAGRKSTETVDFYTRKAGHFVRVLEDNGACPMLLSKLTAEVVDRYISQRRNEGAGDNTVSKELVTLRAALKIARRRGKFARDPAEILPVAFSPAYVPRARNVTDAELMALLGVLPPDRAARVAMAAATSGEFSALDRMERAEVCPAGPIPVHGTKREGRDREVPVVTEMQRRLVKHALAHAEGIEGLLFRPWGNARRDLLAACEEAQIPPLCPTDLRHYCAHHLLRAGASLDLVSRVLGHASGAMVFKVYGAPTTEELDARLRASIGPGTRAGQTGRNPMDTVDGLDASAVTKRRQNKRSSVPRDRVELPTRGFSIPAPIIPKPRDYRAALHPRHRPGTRAGHADGTTVALGLRLLAGGGGRRG